MGSASGARFLSSRCFLTLAAFGLTAVLGCASTPRADTPRPAPPKHLEHALRLLLLVEEKFEHGDWGAAAGITEATAAELWRIEAPLRKAAGSGPVAESTVRLRELEEAIADRDQVRAAAAYAGAERGLFEIVDKFSYAAHPVFSIMDADVRESLELVRAGDFAHAQVELQEVETYLEGARRTLAGKRIPPAANDALSADLQRARAAVEAGDGRAAQAALASLAARTSRLLRP